MKKIYTLIILLALLVPATAQVREWTGGNGAWNDASRWTPTGVPQSSDIVIFNGISATISNVPDRAIKGLVLHGSNIVLQGSGQSATLNVGAGNDADAIEIAGDASLALGNSLSMALANSSSAKIDGVLIVHAKSRYVTDSNAGTITLVKGTLRNAGEILSSASTLEFDDHSIYEHLADHGNIPLATWQRNSNCTIKGVITKAPTGINQVFGNYIWDCAQQTGGPALGVSLPRVIRGNLVINKTGSKIDPAVYLPLQDDISIVGSLIINAGNCVSQGKSITIDLKGNLLLDGGSLRSGSPGDAAIQLNFNGIEKQVFTKTTGSLQGLKVKVSENANLDLGEYVLEGDGDFILEPGAMLTTAHPGGIDLSGRSGAIRLTGKKIFSSEADYAFTGHTAQITGSGLPPVVRRLIIDNQGAGLNAGVSLSKETVITNELALLNGFLQSSDEHMLTIAEQGLTTGNIHSFVAGPMRKSGNASFIFPTGWAGPGGGRIPIGVQHLGSSTIMQAEYKRAPATDKGTTINAPLHHINYCEYWELFPVTGSAEGVVTMYYNSFSSCNPVSLINDFSSTRVARSDGHTWSQVGVMGNRQRDGNGFMISANVATTINKDQRFYALGNITTATDPLPVMFDNVMAYEKGNGVNVEWSNLTERDIAIYFVERSANGMDYTIIGQFLPKNNIDDKASYVSFDPYPANGINFYRIKVIEKSTKIIFSKVMRVEIGRQMSVKLGLYPNPVTNKQLMLELSGFAEGVYNISVINAIGQPLLRSKLTNKGVFMTQPLQLPSFTPPGIYKMVISGEHYRETKTFIVQ